MHKLGGYIKTKPKGEIIHVTEAYERVMKLLNKDDERIKEYRKRVVGDTAHISAPSEYHILGIIKELGITIVDWDSYPITHRAKLLAHHYIKSMVEVIDRHYEEQERERERAFSKTGEGKGK